MYSSRDVDPSPERQLWCAVVGRALDDALGHPGGISGAFAQSRAITEAQDWFRENGTDFRRASEAAGYDPDLLRERVLRMLSSGAARPVKPEATPHNVARHEMAHRDPVQDPDRDRAISPEAVGESALSTAGMPGGSFRTPLYK